MKQVLLLLVAIAYGVAILLLSFIICGVVMVITSPLLRAFDLVDALGNEGVVFLYSLVFIVVGLLFILAENRHKAFQRLVRRISGMKESHSE